MSGEVSSETASSKGLLTAIALLFLGSAISSWSDGKMLSDQRVIAPIIIAVVFLLAAYLPSERVKAVRQSLSIWSSNVWVWAALFGALWIYFAAINITERLTTTHASIAVSETDVSGWPLPNKTAISDLADDLRSYQPDQTVIIYDDAKEEPLALVFAKAMHRANWREPAMVGQLESPRLGIEISVGSEMTPTLEPLKRFCRKELKTEPTILPPSGMGSKSVQITIGHNEED